MTGGGRLRMTASLLAAMLVVLFGAWAQAPAPPQPSGRPPASQQDTTPPAARPGQAAAPAPAESHARAPFPSGETLYYNIAWRVFTAGEARMHIQHHRPEGGKPFWEATVTANSTGFVSKLYKVEDKMVSRFQNGEMCSTSLTKIIHEGRRHRDIRINFEKDRGKAVLKETDLAKNEMVRQVENDIPECVYDVVSALFYVRSLPLEVGKTLEIQLNDGGQTLPITIEVQAREEVRTNAGVFRAIRVEPKVFGGTLFRRSGRMQMWFSDDPQRLLVQLKARLFVGTISAVLERVERPAAPPTPMAQSPAPPAP